ncbi:MAG TPA: hypothetical protein V6D04_13750, partial [Candidatus Obscuribacterales bacterium]
MARRQFYRFRIHAGPQFRPWHRGRQSSPQPPTERTDQLTDISQTSGDQPVSSTANQAEPEA